MPVIVRACLFAKDFRVPRSQMYDVDQSRHSPLLALGVGQLTE